MMGAAGPRILCWQQQTMHNRQGTICLSYLAKPCPHANVASSLVSRPQPSTELHIMSITQAASSRALHEAYELWPRAAATYRTLSSMPSMGRSRSPSRSLISGGFQEGKETASLLCNAGAWSGGNIGARLLTRG
jgi:hypothetical protein